MHNKKVYNISSALERIKSYCALQDRCQWDVLRKLNEWGLQQATKDHILEILITDKFVDEKRFSSIKLSIISSFKMLSFVFFCSPQSVNFLSTSN